MDLANFDLAADAEAGATLQLYNPYTFDPQYPDDVDVLTDDGKPLQIHLVGLDGPTGKKAAARMVKASNRKSGKKQSAKDLTEEEMLSLAAQNEEVQARFYAELTTGWDNISLKGPLEFSPQNAEKLYKTLPWVREQVDRFLARRSNFRRVPKET